MSNPDPLTLKRVDMNTVDINDLGTDACDAEMLLFADKLRSHYGKIPLPETAIDDDLTLYFFWECHGNPVVIRLDPTMWDYVKDPLLDHWAE